MPPPTEYRAPPTGVRLRAMHPDDGPEVRALHQAGIEEGDATFETAAPSWSEFDAAKLAGHRHVAVDEECGRLLGWVAAGPVSQRAVYAGVVEHSVYVHDGARRRGVASALLRALVTSTEAAGIWTVQSGIFPENTASLACHERAGFRVVGRRERMGRLRGHWRDVLLVERRSPLVR